MANSHASDISPPKPHASTSQNKSFESSCGSIRSISVVLASVASNETLRKGRRSP